jgi:flagellar protein FlaG
MRVERIQPELRQTEGPVSINPKEQEKVLEPFMMPLSLAKEDKVLEPFMTPLSRSAQESKMEKGKLEPFLLEKLEDKTKQLNKTVEIFDKKLHFEIHEETDRIMVQIIETETEEVVGEIPPEKVLDLVARIEEMIGLMVDKKV